MGTAHVLHMTDIDTKPKPDLDSTLIGTYIHELLEAHYGVGIEPLSAFERPTPPLGMSLDWWEALAVVDSSLIDLAFDTYDPDALAPRTWLA